MQILLSAVQRSQGCLPLHFVFFNLQESHALPTLFFFMESKEAKFEPEPLWETGSEEVVFEVEFEFEFEFSSVEETGEEDIFFP